MGVSGQLYGDTSASDKQSASFPSSAQRPLTPPSECNPTSVAWKRRSSYRGLLGWTPGSRVLRVVGRAMSGLTSFLLGEREVVPVLLHAVPQGHPQVGLLARRHALPSLLNVGERRVRDGVARGGAAERRGLRSGAQQGAGRRGAHHGGWVGRSGRGERGEMGPIESPVRDGGLSSSRRSDEGGFERWLLWEVKSYTTSFFWGECASASGLEVVV